MVTQSNLIIVEICCCCGKKGVILYSEVVTGHQPYTIGAIASEKETVEKLGSELEEKEKDNKIDSKG
jgi:hypothetical protein